MNIILDGTAEKSGRREEPLVARWTGQLARRRQPLFCKTDFHVPENANKNPNKP
jgi:hypothetical protein